MELERVREGYRRIGIGKRKRRADKDEGLTGTSTFRNIATPLTASLRAMSWGVDTTIAPALVRSTLLQL